MAHGSGFIEDIHSMMKENRIDKAVKRVTVAAPSKNTRCAKWFLYCMKPRGGGTSIETLYGDVPPKWVGF